MLGHTLFRFYTLCMSFAVRQLSHLLLHREKSKAVRSEFPQLPAIKCLNPVICAYAFCPPAYYHGRCVPQRWLHNLLATSKKMKTQHPLFINYLKSSRWLLSSITLSASLFWAGSPMHVSWLHTFGAAPPAAPKTKSNAFMILDLSHLYHIRKLSQLIIPLLSVFHLIFPFSWLLHFLNHYLTNNNSLAIAVLPKTIPYFIL